MKKDMKEIRIWREEMTFTKDNYTKEELTELLAVKKGAKVDAQRLHWIMAYQEQNSLKGKTEQEVDNWAEAELGLLG